MKNVPAGGCGDKRVLLMFRLCETIKPVSYTHLMDSVKNLSGFDRRLVCVPKFCPRECPGRQMCRYQRYLEESRKQDVFIQICNHNYLLADAYHRAEGYKPLLSDYRTLIVDEAHKLPEAARQMFGKNPVSYTHLDVYKRQIKKRLRGWENFFMHFLKK